MMPMAQELQSTDMTLRACACRALTDPKMLHKFDEQVEATLTDPKMKDKRHPQVDEQVEATLTDPKMKDKRHPQVDEQVEATEGARDSLVFYGDDEKNFCQDQIHNKQNHHWIAMRPMTCLQS